MHNVYLGVGRDLLGSGLRLLIERGVFGPNPRLNEVLSEVQAQMVRDCRQRGFLDTLAQFYQGSLFTIWP